MKNKICSVLALLSFLIGVGFVGALEHGLSSIAECVIGSCICWLIMGICVFLLNIEVKDGEGK